MYRTALELIECGYEISLIITSKESPEYNITAFDFEALASKINAVFLNTAKINSENVHKTIKSIGEIDIAVSINYSGVISQNIIDYFKLGILNAHGGDLPRYRGNACQAWALINKESRIGLCVHKMIGGELDSGDIINRDYFEIDINTRIGEIYEWMSETIPKLVIGSLKKLELNENYILERQSLNIGESLRCYPRIPEDGKIFWDRNSEDILRLINASSEPFGGAYCDYNGSKLIVWRAEIYNDDEVYLAVPGQISSINDDGSLILITGNGKLKITEVEINGVRTMNINELVKSIRVRFR